MGIGLRDSERASEESTMLASGAMLMRSLTYYLLTLFYQNCQTKNWLYTYPAYQHCQYIAFVDGTYIFKIGNNNIQKASHSSVKGLAPPLYVTSVLSMMVPKKYHLQNYKGQN